MFIYFTIISTDHKYLYLLHIYSPDTGSSSNTKIYTPLLYPTFNQDMPENELVARHGDWVKKIKYVSSIKESDIVTPAFYIDQYFIKRQTAFLNNLHEEAKKYGKLLVLFTGGDYGITPKQFTNYHLYRMGGYFSKNNGNEFTFPNFFPDPIVKYQQGQQSIIFQKPTKPLIGFCGLGRTNLLKTTIDYLRTTKRFIAHYLSMHPYDTEIICSTTHTRSTLLDTLEQSPLVETNFIRHNKYRAGLKKNDTATKENSSKMFFNNMLQTHYNLCYRGNGNFSVRLYETLSCGRIPIIVMSDNNMAFPDLIDWKRFPIINVNSYNNIDKIVADFHAALSNDDFVALQQYARTIWLNHLSYRGYMNTITDKYLALQSEGKLTGL